MPNDFYSMGAKVNYLVLPTSWLHHFGVVVPWLPRKFSAAPKIRKFRTAERFFQKVPKDFMLTVRCFPKM